LRVQVKRCTGEVAFGELRPREGDGAPREKKCWRTLLGTWPIKTLEL